VPTKRKPGGGKKPKGDFSQLTSPLSIRMPAEMRHQLEKAAKARGNSLSQELLRRLQGSFSRDRDKARDPELRALCYLIAELATATTVYIDANARPRFAWRSDRFFFRAFKLAIGHLFDSLEPAGEIKPPDIDPVYEGRDETLNEIRAALKASFETPEARAMCAFLDVWADLQDQSPPADTISRAPENFKKLVEDRIYGFADARRDLKIQMIGDKS